MDEITKKLFIQAKEIDASINKSLSDAHYLKLLCFQMLSAMQRHGIDFSEDEQKQIVECLENLGFRKVDRSDENGGE